MKLIIHYNSLITHFLLVLLLRLNTDSQYPKLDNNNNWRGKEIAIIWEFFYPRVWLHVPKGSNQIFRVLIATYKYIHIQSHIKNTVFFHTLILWQAKLEFLYQFYQLTSTNKQHIQENRIPLDIPNTNVIYRKKESCQLTPNTFHTL